MTGKIKRTCSKGTLPTCAVARPKTPKVAKGKGVAVMPPNVNYVKAPIK